MKKFLIIICLLFTFTTPAKSWEQKVYEEIKQEVEKLSNECFKKNKPESWDNIGSVGMQTVAIQENKCLEEILKKEIYKAFNKETSDKIWQRYSEMVEATRAFYRVYHNENKYCEPTCGTMAQAFPINNWNDLIQKTLADIMYLNKRKSTY